MVGLSVKSHHSPLNLQVPTPSCLRSRALMGLRDAAQDPGANGSQEIASHDEEIEEGRSACRIAAGVVHPGPKVRCHD